MVNQPPPPIQFTGYSPQSGPLLNSPTTSSQQISQGYNPQGQPTQFTTTYTTASGAPRQPTPAELRSQLPNFKGTQLPEKLGVAGGLVLGGVAAGIAAPPLAVVSVPASLALASSIILSDIAKETKRVQLSDQQLPDFNQTERQFVNSKEYEAIAREGYKGFERQLTGGNFVDNFVTAIPGSVLVDERTRRLFFDAAWSKARELGYTDAQANIAANLALKYDAYPGQIGAVGNALFVESTGNKLSAELYPRLASQAKNLTVAGKAIDVSKLSAAELKSLSPVGISKLNIVQNPLAAVGAKAGGIAGGLEGASEIIQRDIEFGTFGESRPSFSGSVLGYDPGSFEGRLSSQLERVGIGGAAGTFTGAAFQTVIGGQQIARPGTSKFVQGVGYVSDVPEFFGDVLSDAQLRAVRGAPLTYTGIPSQFASSGTRRINFNVPSIAAVLGLTQSAPSIVSSQSTNESLANTISDTKAAIDAQAQTQAQTQANTQANIQSVAQSQAQSAAQTPSFVQSQAITDAITESKTEATSDTQAQSDAQTQAQTQAETQANTQANTQSNVLVASNTSTPIFRGIVPLPPLFPINSGGGGTPSRTGELLYFDELGRARRLLRNLL